MRIEACMDLFTYSSIFKEHHHINMIGWYVVVVLSINIIAYCPFQTLTCISFALTFIVIEVSNFMHFEYWKFK